MIAVGDTVWLGSIVGVVIIVAIILGRNITGKLGAVAFEVASVNKAVNSRPAGQPTISDQVATTAARVDDIHVNVEALTTSMVRRNVDVDRQFDQLARRITDVETASALTLAAISDRVSALEIHQPQATVHVAGATTVQVGHQ